ncbi:glycosyltransferase [Photobacterium damselae]
MKFSVLMSVYIKEKPIFLDRCLNSIANQSVRPNEIILVLDGFIKDELHAVINKWSKLLPLKTFQLKHNVGLGRALNFGLNKCKYDLVARMDTDDICLPFRFEYQLNKFKMNKKLSICGSHIIEIEPDNMNILGKRVVPLKHDKILKSLIWKNPFNHMTVMYRKQDVNDVGGYIDLPWMEDWYLWLRLLSNGYTSCNINQILVIARTGNLMLNRRKGMSYIHSEWLMTKYKMESKKFSSVLCLLAFIKRSLPRLLPNKILSFVYSCSRV